MPHTRKHPGRHLRLQKPPKVTPQMPRFELTATAPSDDAVLLDLTPEKNQELYAGIERTQQGPPVDHEAAGEQLLHNIQRILRRIPSHKAVEVTGSAPQWAYGQITFLLGWMHRTAGYAKAAHDKVKAFRFRFKIPQAA